MAYSALSWVVKILVFSSTALGYVNQTKCNGIAYTYNNLAGYGYIPGNAVDKYGDTIGGIGSSIAIDKSSWKKLQNGSYTGTMYALPDRGWNTEGTLNYQNRIQKIAITFTPNPSASASNPAKPNLQLVPEETILLTGPDGTPTTGLDGDVLGPYLSYSGFPTLPAATYTGDGFNGSGPGGHRISVDSEGIFLGADGTFWVSDEYGPYIYQFGPNGKMLKAIQPPAAYLPRRNGSLSFSADSPPIYNLSEVIDPADVGSGRDNNQGFEGLTVSSNGKRLYTLLQSALAQEGGTGNPERKQSRFLEYDISGKTPKYVNEFVITLPLYNDGKKVAAQSEIHYISDTQFLILARDSGAGHGQDNSESKYRHVDVFDISKATSIKDSTNDAATGSIASSKGELDSEITAAEYCSFIDFNVNSQLARFGLHNGGDQNATLLNEKWESLALVPVNPGTKKSKNTEYYLFSLSDNDFITQDGHMNFGKFAYKDTSGYNLDNQALVFHVTIST